MARPAEKPQKRPKPYRPPDAAEIERFLDGFAEQMAKFPRDAHLFLPHWRACERELAKARENEAALRAARERFTRLQDRKEARSS